MEVHFKQAHKHVVNVVKQEARSRTVRAANALKKASNKVLSNAGGRSGATYRKPATSSTYTASAPGEPPALRSGNLRNSWEPLPYSEMVSSDTVYTPGIRTDVKYAPYLQDGTKKMAARPFEEPIKQEAWPQIQQIYGQPYLS